MARALVSVANKDGIAGIVRTLHHAGLEIVSTGGTLRALRDANIPATPVDEVTRYPEMLDGRVKTLHPAIHGGILFRRDIVEHSREIDQYGIKPIDVVIGTLYPFEETVMRPGVTELDAIENIDIGGPTLIRAAAKNHRHVVVIVDPRDYQRISALIEEGGLAAIDDRLRRELAVKAFDHTAAYDALIAGWMGDDPFPDELTIAGRQISSLKYGENPHQQAAAYLLPGTAGLHGIGGWTVKSDDELSYNNYLDATAAWSAVAEFDDPAAVIVKHNAPCGVAIDSDPVIAFERALAGDPVSAFGGVIGANRPISDELAGVIAQRKYDVVLAPGYGAEALSRLEDWDERDHDD
jgi:phosphoribosylaminoimidazolecarboxamide formyltransferase / IMP cyclohydrolase